MLNRAQRQAVTTLKGPVLVVAGAGTGKTRVLEYRTLELVKSGVDPRSILLLTFTRRAAGEMLFRSARLDSRCKYVAGGTFHSFALSILQKYGNLLGLGSFTVLDRSDAEDLHGKIIADLKLRDKKYFPKKRTVTDIISKSINKETSIEAVLEDEYRHLYEWAKVLELIQTKAAAYKKTRNLLNFDDLLFYFRELLNNHRSVRENIHRTYQYVMVDEYQDTNKIQASIVELLGKRYGNVLVVGDEMQSIYRFRGAEFANIMRFSHMFPKTKKITLEENYRSTQEILDVANNILDQVEGEHFKKYLSSDRSGETPEYYQFKSQKEEASWVVEKMLELTKDRKLGLKDIAVLFRASYQSASLEIELASRKIPYKKYGGIRFAETAHIKDVLAHLKVITNPEDDLSWRRILLLVKKVGEKTSERILRSKSKDLVYKLQDINGQNPELGQLEMLLKTIINASLTPSEKITEIIKYYNPILRGKYDDYPQREQDLEALMELSLSYKKDKMLLNDFALDPPAVASRQIWLAGHPETSAVDVQTLSNDFVTLSTIHSAKGLEWNTVFVIQAQEGKFPIVRPETGKEDIEEERRLFYVAVTRAKQYLFFTSSHDVRRGYYGSRFATRMSRFIEPLVNNALVATRLLPKDKRYGGVSRFNRYSSTFSGLPEQDIDEL